MGSAMIQSLIARWASPLEADWLDFRGDEYTMIAGRKFTPLIATAIAIPALADASAATPEFSGIWARNSFNFEAPPSGPGPITNMKRVGADASRPILGGDPVPLVGDYTNPILKPHAADRPQGGAARDSRLSRRPVAGNGAWA